MPYGKEQQKFFGLLVRTLDWGGEADNLLYSTGEAIRESVENIEQAAAEPGDSFEKTWVIDDECDQIEDLLGLSFVACQLYITTVVSHCKGLHDLHKQQTGNRQIAGHTGEKQGLLQRCEVCVAGTPYTAITAIDALANYFKHRNEWHFDWSVLKGNVQRTALVIQALGVKSGCTGNLRKGFEAIFGDSDYQQVLRLGHVLRNWADALKAEYQRELMALAAP